MHDEGRGGPEGHCDVQRGEELGGGGGESGARVRQRVRVRMVYWTGGTWLAWGLCQQKLCSLDRVCASVAVTRLVATIFHKVVVATFVVGE